MPERHAHLDDLSGPTWDLATAAEIRHRGDVRSRRRRARTTLAGVGATALLAVPTTMAIGGAGGGATLAERPDAPITSATSRAWPTSVPPGLELDRGLDDGADPAAPGSAAGTTLALVEICGRTWWTDGQPARAADMKIVTGTGVGGTHERRTLLVYGDPAAADAALAGVRRTSASCAGTGTDGVVDMASFGTDVASWGFVASRTARGDREAVLAVRVANTVLLSQTAADDRGADELHRLGNEAVTVLEQLCELDPGHC